MKSIYKKLLQLKISHSYYSNGKSNNDFLIKPSSLCKQMLDDYGFIFRNQNDGFNLYVEVVPDSDPLTLFRSIGATSFKLCFYMIATNNNLHTMSSLPNYRFGKEIFYFNNLHDFSNEDDELIMGDSVAEQETGEPIVYINNQVYNYKFAAPVAAATLEIKNIFGESIYSKDIQAEGDAGVVDEVRINLNGINKLVPGRYKISDNHGGVKEFYYDPAMIPESVFGVMEIFSDTTDFTNDASNKVPEIYQFISAENLLDVDSYIIGMETRATRWRYIVEKKYLTNGISLEDLKITGPEAFTETQESGTAIFVSNESILLHENPLPLKLVGSDDKGISNLPSPTQKTQLKFNVDSNQYESHMYIYI